MVSLDLEGNDILIRFPFSLELVDRVKTLTHRWDKRTMAWRINWSRIGEVRKLFPGASHTHSLTHFLSEDIRGAAVIGLNPAFGLRPHQRTALDKFSYQKRCALLDEPGSGKTRVAVAWSAALGTKRLIICPSVVKIFWTREIQTCLPGAVIAILSGRSADTLEALLHGPAGIRQDAEWVIGNYDILDARLPELLDFGFDCLIYDEAHLLKSGDVMQSKKGTRIRGSKRGNAALKLAAHVPRVMVLTGSPMPNGRPIELLPMLVMLEKVHPREIWDWKMAFCAGTKIMINEKGVKYHGRKAIYRWSFSGASRLDDLGAQLSTFSVQRRKSEIMEYLPPIEHTVFDVELPDLAPYEEMRERMRKLIRSGDPQARGEALGLLTKMLAWSAEAKCSNALEILDERLSCQKSKVVVMCDYLAPLGVLRQKLLHRSTILEGSMSEGERQSVIDKFQTNPEPHALLVSRRIGGSSITLTAADTYLGLNLPWTPGDYTQAVARVHRETQTKRTQAITILAKNTYDEEQFEMVYYKARVIERTAGRPPLPESRKIEFEQMVKLLGGAEP